MSYSPNSYADDHDIAFRRDWMGDPNVIHGTVEWDTPYCKVCGAEGEEELESPCTTATSSQE
jgi:hypothetical protein